MRKKIFGGIVVLFTVLLVSNKPAKAQINTIIQEGAAETQFDSSDLDEQKQKEFEYLFVEALKQKMLGDTQRAIQLLSSCLEIDPNSSAAMYELASIYASNNEFTNSSLLLEKAINLNPENKWYKILLSQIYQQLRRYEKAAELYADLLEKDPDNLEYLYREAFLLTNAGQYDEAIVLYNTLEEKAGISEQISMAKEELYLEMGEVKKAFQEIEKLIEYNPNESSYYGLLADLYKEQGDRENALKNYNKILEMDPDNGFVHLSLAGFYLENGETEKSFEETKKGFLSDEVEVQTKLQMYVMLTSNRLQTGITDEKQDELVQILMDKYPDEYLVYTLSAENLIRKNKLQEAGESLVKALELDPSDYTLWERLLYIDNDLQQWDSLYSHSKTTIELFPNQPQTYFFNAVACIQLEKYEETVDITDEGLDYIFDNPALEGQFLMLKGDAVYKLNRVDDAFKLFDKAIELDPENYIALNNYAYYLSLAGRDLDKAEQMISKVVSQYPDNATYLDTYAWVLFKKGDYENAKFYMEKALDNDGENNPTLLEHYGDILFMLQKLEEAKEFWEKAKNNGGVSEVLERKIKEQKYIEE